MPGLGRTIKTLRVAAGVKQGDFAEQVGMTQAYLSALEADKRTPSLDLVEKIARALGVPSGALLSCSTTADDLPSQYAELYDKLQGLQELLLRLMAMESAKNELQSKAES